MKYVWGNLDIYIFSEENKTYGQWDDSVAKGACRASLKTNLIPGTHKIRWREPTHQICSLTAHPPTHTLAQMHPLCMSYISNNYKMKSKKQIIKLQSYLMQHYQWAESQMRKVQRCVRELKNSIFYACLKYSFFLVILLVYLVFSFLMLFFLMGIELHHFLPSICCSQPFQQPLPWLSTLKLASSFSLIRILTCVHVKMYMYDKPTE